MGDNKKFRVASYIRLSREDGDKKESESITNQRNIIMRYIKENDLQFIDEYVDDGVSGTTFERSGFKRMLTDVEQNKINMIITKDLSRLGREYIQTGYYLENYFPEHMVRYVAINDGIDTFSNSTCNDITPFKSIMNDMYAKDISKKVRSVIKEKQKKGEYICTVPPYGYKKDIKIKNHLVIDNDVAYIVKHIFNMYLDGNSVYKIRDYLNDNKIQSPSGYAKHLVEIKKWNSVTLLNILSNKAYIGVTVSNKRTNISYKSKKRINVPKEEYIITENTHKAIISKEVFEEVQFLLSKKSINKNNKHEYLFRGLIKCKTCHSNLDVGAKLTIRGKKIHNPIPYMTCRNSKKGICPAKHMNYDKFEKELLSKLNEFLELEVDKQKLYSIYKNYKKNSTENIKCKKDLDDINKRLKVLSNQIDSVYFDKLNNLISKEDYYRYTDKIIREQKLLEKQKIQIMNLINSIQKTEDKISDEAADKVIDKFLKVEEFSKKFLYKLIDYIEVDENKNVYIYFSFRGIEIKKEEKYKNI